jgi:hypothetical protein
MQSSALSVIENMSDIIAYAHTKLDSNGNSSRVLTLRSLDNSVRCGCRFKHIAPEIDFSYEALTKALNDAIDQEAKENNNQFTTTERLAAPTIITYDYDALYAEFQEIVGKLIQQDGNYYAPRVTQIVEKYLGKGKKVADTNREQAEFIHLIVSEIKEDLIGK